MNQLLQILNEKDSDSDDDNIMKNINDINELSAPYKQEDTPDIIQQKLNKVQEMVNSMKNLGDNEKQQLIKEISEHIDVYSLSGENFKQTDIVEHEINLESDIKPFHQRLRVYSPPLQQIIDTEVNKMIQDNIIIKSNSPFASNLLLVRKPDLSSPGGIKNRVCVNFIQLNKLTVKDRYPLPNQQDIFRQIGSAKYFTTMDLMSGFWQIAIKPEHRHKTAFITTRGLYEFLVMPFGLCNAPSTFQRMMDRIIKPEYRSFIQTYIDDIILYSKTFSEHIKHISVLHQILRENKLTVKLSKCHFSQNSVKFLGHVLSEGIIKPNPEKIEAIEKWQLPKDSSAVRSFLGAVGWYRKFIPHFAELAVPLIKLTKKNVVFKFDNECEKSFEILRKALITEPVLKQADINKDYMLETDASDKAISAVLLQEDSNGDKHPIAYASKTLNPAQINYSTSEKECLALVWGLEHFNSYIEGHSFTCLTDHRALTYLIGSKESNNQRLTRWILRLQPYNLKVKYVKGTDNNTADLLSRPDLLNKAYINHYSVKNDYIYFNGTDIGIRRSTRDRVPTANFYAKEPIHRKGYENKKVNINNNININNNVNNSNNDININNGVNNSNNAISVNNDSSSSSVNITNSDSNNDINNNTSNNNKVRRTKTKHGTRAEKQLLTYDVESILDKRKIHENTNECEYLVKWKNYDDSFNTWENLHQLKGCINLVLDYENKHRKIFNNVNSNNKNYECDECTETFKLAHNYYIHRYKEHDIPIPKLDSELGIIEEIDDIVLSDYQENDNSLKYIYDSELGVDLSNITNNRERKDLLNHEFYYNENGVLYTVDTNVNNETCLKLVLPKQLRRKLISEVHDGVMSAHPGIIHTCKRIGEVAWWPYWRSDIIRYILSCEKCQRAKRKKMLNQLPRPVSVSSRPFQHIGVDIVGPFPVSQKGNVYILTIVDHFTRWAEAIPMPEQTSKCIAQNIIKYVICRHGLFDIMTSDNGSVFVSEIANYIYKELGIKRRRTTPHHPQSNGIPERFHDTMKTMLKIWCNEEQDNWDEYLPYVLFAYNTSYHTLLQETPFFLVNGRDPKLLSDIIINKSYDTYSDVYNYGDELINKLKTVYNRIKQIYTDINEKRVLALNNIQEKQFNIGDKVLIYDPTTKIGLSRKLTIRWKGPYTIIEKRNDINYVINIDGKMSLVNKHRLRLFNDNNNDILLYNDEQTLLQEEVTRLSELEIELRNQKQYKELQLEIAKANQQIIVNNDNNNNKY
jgi:transposase InsO family protein